MTDPQFLETPTSPEKVEMATRKLADLLSEDVASANEGLLSAIVAEMQV